MTGCINYLSNIAQYLGVCSKDLAKGVRALKWQSKDALKAAEEGQQNQAEQERLRELEARNQEMERTLTSMGEMLQQHTSHRLYYARETQGFGLTLYLCWKTGIP
jgi:hypothetical protein